MSKVWPNGNKLLVLVHELENFMNAISTILMHVLHNKNCNSYVPSFQQHLNIKSVIDHKCPTRRNNNRLQTQTKTLDWFGLILCFMGLFAVLGKPTTNIDLLCTCRKNTIYYHLTLNFDLQP